MFVAHINFRFYDSKQIDVVANSGWIDAIAHKSIANKRGEIIYSNYDKRISPMLSFSRVGYLNFQFILCI